ncbi:DNA-directed RNA polymerase subunit beta [Streptococcus minor]|uniref:DNA-directed RNA polymerase subunit beta n=3 Tax=Streptococcus minor TaxID=229549 RepID=A0A3P1VEJ6_9STRE|nr:DNA-directed RNA polymerase subunit beta [Streptococcus minor]
MTMNRDTMLYVGRQLLFVFLILILAFIIFAIGLMVGYSVVGDGDNAMSILSLDKWQEIISKFTGK